MKTFVSALLGVLVGALLLSMCSSGRLAIPGSVSTENSTRMVSDWLDILSGIEILSPESNPAVDVNVTVETRSLEPSEIERAVNEALDKREVGSVEESFPRVIQPLTKEQRAAIVQKTLRDLESGALVLNERPKSLIGKVGNFLGLGK